MSDADRDGFTEVEVATPEQAIVVFDGSGPVILTDTMAPIDMPDLFPNSVVRRVLVARLRAWADAIEQVDVDQRLGIQWLTETVTPS